LILEKTEGVPIFSIEEFIKSLKDLKIIEKKRQLILFIKRHSAFDHSFKTIQDVDHGKS